ncbi:hypothetical protein RchiOBHm_Chr7g0193671 [Rosa chinensis]|uniref:Uncharacterized protein n=1 Tax=Rosa chinensis TaxID=74649 RepID=A0A2P6P5V7_ROSCH|nr:hypothetical protein RchiOBHm_Chr7g0193671 [Rosa chinensis]
MVYQTPPNKFRSAFEIKSSFKSNPKLSLRFGFDFASPLDFGGFGVDLLPQIGWASRTHIQFLNHSQLLHHLFFF